MSKKERQCYSHCCLPLLTFYLTFKRFMGRIARHPVLHRDTSLCAFLEHGDKFIGEKVRWNPHCVTMSREPRSFPSPLHAIKYVLGPFVCNARAWIRGVFFVFYIYVYIVLFSPACFIIYFFGFRHRKPRMWCWLVLTTTPRLLRYVHACVCIWTFNWDSSHSPSTPLVLSPLWIDHYGFDHLFMTVVWSKSERNRSFWSAAEKASPCLWGSS